MNATASYRFTIVVPLYDEREKVADAINQILLHNLKNNIRFCAKCGAALPLHRTGRLCAKCWRGLPYRGGKRS